LKAFSFIVFHFQINIKLDFVRHFWFYVRIQVRIAYPTYGVNSISQISLCYKEITPVVELFWRLAYTVAEASFIKSLTELLTSLVIVATIDQLNLLLLAICC